MREGGRPASINIGCDCADNGAPCHGHRRSGRCRACNCPIGGQAQHVIQLTEFGCRAGSVSRQHRLGDALDVSIRGAVKVRDYRGPCPDGGAGGDRRHLCFGERRSPKPRGIGRDRTHRATPSDLYRGIIRGTAFDKAPIRFKVLQGLGTVICQKLGLAVRCEHNLSIARQDRRKVGGLFLDRAGGPVGLIGGFLRRAPFPVGRVFAGLRGAQLCLCVFDLLIAACVGGQLHIRPDGAHQLRDGARINDLLAVAVNQAAVVDVDRHDFARGINQIDAQIIGARAVAIVDFAQINVPCGRNVQLIVRSDARVDPDICIRSRTANAALGTVQGDRPTGDQLCRPQGPHDAIVPRQGDRGLIPGAGDRADPQQTDILANVDGAAGCRINSEVIAISPIGRCAGGNIRRRADGDRQRHGGRADVAARSDRDLAGRHIGLGLAIARRRIRVGGRFGRDVAQRTQRDRAQRVGQTPINDKIGLTGIDIDLALRVVQEVDVNRIIGLDRMGMGDEVPNVAVVLIGVGLLAIPARAHVVIGLLPVRRAGDDIVAAVGIGSTVRR